jgi:hypothetical protein
LKKEKGEPEFRFKVRCVDAGSMKRRLQSHGTRNLKLGGDKLLSFHKSPRASESILQHKNH